MKKFRTVEQGEVGQAPQGKTQRERLSDTGQSRTGFSTGGRRPVFLLK